jgi:hypothetical protein
MDFRHWDIFEFLTPDGKEEVPYLIVPRLFDVLTDALHDYESDLNSDVALQRNFEARYSRLVSCDRKEMEILRKLCGGTGRPPEMSGASVQEPEGESQ